MNISFNELSAIKHQLPTGSIKQIAETLGIEEQTVRNYFGANKYEKGAIVEKSVVPGPQGGIVTLEDTTILEMAQKINAAAAAAKAIK